MAIPNMSIQEKANFLLDNVEMWMIDIYAENAQDYVVDYCGFKDDLSDMPRSLNSVLVDMIVFQARNNGVENLKAEGKGSLSESYLTEYPPNIMNRLNRYCRVKFL